MPQMTGMQFPLPTLKENVLFATNNGSPPAGSTRYLYFTDQAGGGGMYSTNSATEGTPLCNYLVTRSSLLRNLCVCVQAVPGTNQRFVYTVRVNGVATAITVTISGAAAYSGNDLVNTAHVVVGDRVTVEVVTSATATATTHTAALEVDFPSTRTSFDRVGFGTGTATIAVNTTRYIYENHRAPSYDAASSSLSEVVTSLRHNVARKSSLKNLIVLAGSAPGAGETFIYTVRVNAVNTSMTVTLSGAAQVTGTDTANVVQVDAGSYITLSVKTSSGAAVTAHAASFDLEEGDYRAG